MPMERVVCANAACKLSSRRGDLQQGPAGLKETVAATRKAPLEQGSPSGCCLRAANTVLNVQCNLLHCYVYARSTMSGVQLRK